MDDVTQALARLHTQVVDAEKGFEEAVKLAERPEIGALFRDLRDLHAAHGRALARTLGDRGASVDADGSFMATVHKAVLNVRAALTGLGETELPAVLDGEERLLDDYDEALEATSVDPGPVIFSASRLSRGAAGGRRRHARGAAPTDLVRRGIRGRGDRQQHRGRRAVASGAGVLPPRRSAVPVSSPHGSQGGEGRRTHHRAG